MLAVQMTAPWTIFGMRDIDKATAEVGGLDERDERFQREELIRERIKNRRSRERKMSEQALMEAYECEHCGSAFELDTKHPICSRCEAAVCHKGCSDGNCPAW